MHWMYQNGVGPESWGFMGIDPIFVMGFLPLLMVWSIAWKGWALYLAARRGEVVWFIVMLIVNTAGLLEIFYIFVIAKRSDVKDESSAARTTSETTTETKS